MHSHYLRLTIESINLKDSSYSKVLVISEDWCGDAMMNLPILKRISESLQLEVRVFHRDEDTNLIDRYLTNGFTARSIQSLSL